MQFLTDVPKGSVFPAPSLFRNRKFYEVVFRWRGREWSFTGSAEFAADFGSALFDARDILPLDDGPYVWPVWDREDFGRVFRRTDVSIKALGHFMGAGTFGARVGEVFRSKLRLVDYEFPTRSEFKARAV
ncbi:MAG: hypothetical protein RLW87_07960 [Alphaproteobacteria bacterium]